MVGLANHKPGPKTAQLSPQNHSTSKTRKTYSQPAVELFDPLTVFTGPTIFKHLFLPQNSSVSNSSFFLWNDFNDIICSLSCCSTYPHKIDPQPLHLSLSLSSTDHPILCHDSPSHKSLVTFFFIFITGHLAPWLYVTSFSFNFSCYY